MQLSRSAKIVPTQLTRVETATIPPDAMREIFATALIHRDYSIAAAGRVALTKSRSDDRR
jgi:predicted HTH transcriptional regulator